MRGTSVSEKWLTGQHSVPIYFFSGAVFCHEAYWFLHKIRKQAPSRGHAGSAQIKVEDVKPAVSPLLAAADTSLSPFNQLTDNYHGSEEEHQMHWNRRRIRQWNICANVAQKYQQSELSKLRVSIDTGVIHWVKVNRQTFVWYDCRREVGCSPICFTSNLIN